MGLILEMKRFHEEISVSFIGVLPTRCRIIESLRSLFERNSELKKELKIPVDKIEPGHSTRMRTRHEVSRRIILHYAFTIAPFVCPTGSIGHSTSRNRTLGIPKRDNREISTNDASRMHRLKEVRTLFVLLDVRVGWRFLVDYHQFICSFNTESSSGPR